MPTSDPLYVVVSGPPGSGKTTLAAALAQQMRLPLVAKDLIKESLMSVLTISDVEMSKLIGRAAVQVMYSVAKTAPSGAVLEATFIGPLHGPRSRSFLAESLRSSAVVIARSHSLDTGSERSSATQVTWTSGARTTSSGAKKWPTQ